MPLFSTAQIERSAQQAEDIFAAECPCIVERLSIAIVNGTAEYTLPDYIMQIRKVLWLGVRIDPINHREYRDSQLPVSTGKPWNYIFNNIGKQKIRFFPVPNNSISASQTGLWADGQRTKVIIEYYRHPDYTTYTIPSYFRRRLLKAFVLKMRFAAEGKGKDLKASKYFSDKFNMLKELYSEQFRETMIAPLRIIGNTVQGYSRAGFAHLSTDYGIGVDLGE